jgi:hypothetical protein
MFHSARNTSSPVFNPSRAAEPPCQTRRELIGLRRREVGESRVKRWSPRSVLEIDAGEPRSRSNSSSSFFSDDSSISIPPPPPPPPPLPLTPSDFESVVVLGKGSFGKVILVRRNGAPAGPLYAMKLIRKARICRPKQIQRMKVERHVLELCGDHPFIVRKKMKSLLASAPASNFPLLDVSPIRCLFIAHFRHPRTFTSYCKTAPAVNCFSTCSASAASLRRSLVSIALKLRWPFITCTSTALFIVILSRRTSYSLRMAI